VDVALQLLLPAGPDLLHSLTELQLLQNDLGVRLLLLKFFQRCVETWMVASNNDLKAVMPAFG